MATLDEILSFSENEESYLVENPQFLIDEDLRTIAFDSRGSVIGVVGDKNVNRINFQMNRMYNGFDMSEFQIRVNYVNAAGQPNYYNVTDMEIDGDIIRFSWLVDSDATAYIGNVMFVCVLYKLDGSVITQAFNTTIASASVLEGLAVDGYVDPETQHDIVTHMIEDILSHVPEFGTLVDKVNELSESVTDIKFEARPVLVGTEINGFGLYPQDMGFYSNPNASVIVYEIEPNKVYSFNKTLRYAVGDNSDVSTSAKYAKTDSDTSFVNKRYKYLFINGRNSSGVQIGGTVAESKVRSISTEVAFISGGYVVPEMFGAVGDGVADDTYAVQSAINYCVDNNLKLVFSKGKTYGVSSELVFTIPSALYVDFNYAKIKALNTMQRLIYVKCNKNIISTDGPMLNDYNVFKNMHLDLNGYYGRAFYVDYGNNVILDGFVIDKCKSIGISVDAGGINVNNGYIICHHSTSKSIGISIATSDSCFNDIVIVDADIAVNNSGTNFYDKVHAWNSKNVEDTIFFAHNGGNAQLVQCACDTYEIGYMISTDRRLSLAGCTYYVNSPLYDSPNSPVVFKYADTAKWYIRNTSCVNCTFDALRTEVNFCNYLDHMINMVGCWKKGTVNHFEPKVTLTLSNGVSASGNTQNANEFWYKDDVVSFDLALNVSGVTFGASPVQIGKLGTHTYWYPPTNLVVPCLLYTDEWDTKWYTGYLFFNRNNGIVEVKANQALPYTKIVANGSYRKAQVIYNG